MTENMGHTHNLSSAIAVKSWRVVSMINKTCLALILVLGLAGGTAPLPPEVYAQSQAVESQSEEDKVVAYYFHTNTRCSTCRKIEAYSIEAIEEGFPNELKNGRLEMRIVNYQSPENRHFIQDYNLITKSLILVNLVDGEQTKWTNLKLVWQLTKSKDSFLNYVRGEVQDYLSQK